MNNNTQAVELEKIAELLTNASLREEELLHKEAALQAEINSLREQLENKNVFDEGGIEKTASQEKFTYGEEDVTMGTAVTVSPHLENSSAKQKLDSFFRD